MHRSPRPARPHLTVDPAARGAGRRVALLVAGLVTLGASATVALTGASAASQGTSTAQSANVALDARASAVPALATVLAGLDLSASSPAVTSPSAPGSDTDAVGLAARAVGASASAATGVATARATRTPGGTSAASTVADANIGLLGTPLVTTGVISSSSTCPAGGPGTATTSVADARIGRTTVDAAAGARGDVAVHAAGLTAAAVTVAITSPHSETTTSATGVGLLVSLTLHGSLLGSAVSVPLGTVTLAASSCAAPAAATAPTAPTTPTAPNAPTAAIPTITGLDPTSGPTAGDQLVTVMGTGFTPGTTVSFDGLPAGHVTVASSTSLTATTPAHPVGPVEVVATTAAGSSSPGTYTFVASVPGAPAPTVTGLDPASGPTAGGQTVTVMGTGFTPGTTMSFDGLPAGHVTVASSTSLTATTPAHPVGPVEVVATTAAGSSSPGTYTFVASTGTAPSGTAPTVTAISPDSGPVAGGQSVTVTGSGLTPGAAVTLGSGQATDVVVNPAGTQLTAVTPAGTAGPVDVDIDEAGGSTASLPAAYTFVPAPTIGGADSSSGPSGGGQHITITGSGFVSGRTQVLFGTHPATGVEVLSQTRLTARTPAGSGAVHVVVATPGGRATSPNLYAYVLAKTFSTSDLPFTGIDSLELLGVGGWALAGGAWSVLFARRRRLR